ncbi:MAG: hypothetical protein J2P18_19410, partial [Nocardia sp.]|nr:hypothetical protein [Nocardia sp.]
EPGMPPAPNGAPPPGPNFGPGRAPGGPGPGGLPAWSARRHPGAGAPDSGPRPFGAGNFGPENPESGEFGPPADEHGHMPRRGVIDLLDPSEDRTEYYEPVPYDATQHDYDASQQDYDDEYDGYDDEYDQYDDYDGAEDAEDQGSRRRGRRSGKRSLPGRGALAGRMALPSALSGRGSGSARGLLAAGRPSRAGAAEAGGRKQWLILAGQVIGASVLGMLLFKGFEQLWISMPTLALVLAMVVILGLVALVRVLRRTDDILSTVIAIVVGVFVTLGPLTFVLSAG